MLNKWTSDFVETNSIRFHYTRTGGDKPALLLAHGFSDDGLCWTALAESLPEFDIIMPDARGHGRSADPPTGYSRLEHAADLAALIETLELKKPFVLGHSMGAISTLTLAATYPQLVKAILLEDPPPFWAFGKHEDITKKHKPHDSIKTWITAVKRNTKEEMVTAQQKQNPSWSPSETERWADAKIRLSLHAINGLDYLHLPMNWLTTIQNISCPSLLICADPERGAATTPAQAELLKQMTPQLQVAQIAGAGHDIRRDQFDAYVATIQKFLKNTF